MRYQCENGFCQYTFVTDSVLVRCPNCKCKDCRLIKEDRMPKETMTRRFYASCSAVEYQPLLSTYLEALADAKKKLNEPGSKANKLEEIYIVEVVTKVKFAQPEVKPIEVIEIRK